MTDDEKARAIAALIAAADEASAAAAATIFGHVPAWVPPPIVEKAWRTAAGLLADGADPREIRRRIDATLSDQDMSEAASPHLSFVRAVDHLAEFVYGVSLGECDGLSLLAGDQAEQGQRFKRGRKVGTVGPIRKAVAKLLAKSPEATTAQLWDAISEKPPRGWQAFDNPQGKYLEAPKVGVEMGYRRFANVCSEERRKGKTRITD